MAAKRKSRRTPHFLFVGIDVSYRTLTVAWETVRSGVRVSEFENTEAGHRTLVHMLTAGKKPRRVCVEATSTYMLDVLFALSDAGVGVMLVNPFQARKFAQANQRRSKTDGIDAELLLEYARRMPWEAWTAPALAVRTLRSLGRRLHQVVKMRCAEQHRLHAARATHTTPEFVTDLIRETIVAFHRQELAIIREAMKVIRTSPELKEAFEIVTSIPGVAARTAISVLGELMVLPKDMTAKQVVAFCGIDPRQRQSGNHQGRVKISRIGNRQVRGALYMPAVTACNHDPRAKALKERLLAKGKPAKVAHVAQMRRMLVLIWVLLITKKAFDPNFEQQRREAA